MSDPNIRGGELNLFTPDLGEDPLNNRRLRFGGAGDGPGESLPNLLPHLVIGPESLPKLKSRETDDDDKDQP